MFRVEHVSIDHCNYKGGCYVVRAIQLNIVGGGIRGLNGGWKMAVKLEFMTPQKHILNRKRLIVGVRTMFTFRIFN